MFEGMTSWPLGPCLREAPEGGKQRAPTIYKFAGTRPDSAEQYRQAEKILDFLLRDGTHPAQGVS
jgi:hypothetical protein